jgi:hypothetical protein
MQKTRSQKLIRPGLQLRLTLTFVGLTAFALLFQFLLFTSVTSSTLSDIPGEVSLTFAAMPEAYLRVLLLSAGVVLPLTVAVGVLATFRVAGPIYGIMRFLSRLAVGEDPGECRIRRGDEYEDLCRLANDVAEAFRRRRSGAPETQDDGTAEPPSLVRDARDAAARR